ncbi:hypothetical protein [Paenibacillus sp. KN14-4R]|uniref:hypothetical protein n=1 Tax=Paenibacillus sp. KN14-4R TaxID=3445773 RepID=UPI003F9F8F60
MDTNQTVLRKKMTATPAMQPAKIGPHFNGLLQTSPVETQKTLIQTIVKQIAVQQGQKLRGIELEFDETLRQCLVVAAPSTDKVDGALSRYKYPSPFTIVI